MHVFNRQILSGHFFEVQVQARLRRFWTQRAMIVSANTVQEEMNSILLSIERLLLRSPSVYCVRCSGFFSVWFAVTDLSLLFDGNLGSRGRAEVTPEWRADSSAIPLLLRVAWLLCSSSVVSIFPCMMIRSIHNADCAWLFQRRFLRPKTWHLGISFPTL